MENGYRKRLESVKCMGFRDELWIGNRRDFPANLTLMRMINTDFIYASFLTEEHGYLRERARDALGPKKKRKFFLKST